MNFEKSVLQNQSVSIKENALKRKNEKEIENFNRKKNDREGDLSVGRREFLKTVAKTVAVGALGFGVGDLLKEDDNAAEKGQENKNGLVLENEKTVAEENESALDTKEAPAEKPAVQEPEAEKQKIKEEDKNKTEKEKIKMFFEKIAEAHSQIKNSEQLWRKELFPEPLLIAQEIVESGLDGKKVSPKGATGICQLMPISVRADLEYLDALQKNKIINYEGQSEINDEDLEAIMQVVQKDDTACRKLRDIYLSYLGPNNVFGPNIGEKELKKNNLERSRQYILAAYNMGPGNFKKIKKWRDWPQETKNYTWKVEEYHDKIKETKKELIAMGKKVDNYEQIGHIVMKNEA